MYSFNKTANKIFDSQFLCFKRFNASLIVIKASDGEKFFSNSAIKNYAKIVMLRMLECCANSNTSR